MCPYDQWERGFYIFCEAQRCGWIREPLNTLSNFGFFLVGIFLFRKYCKVPQIRIIGIAAILVGILSAFYHATSSRFGETLDLGSMYLLVGGLASFNLQRLGLIGIRTSETLAAILALVLMAILIAMPGSGRLLFDGFIVITLSLELVLYFRSRSRGPRTYSYRFLGLALVCHGTAFFFWHLDHERILCFPQSLFFQGHAVWHLIGAVTFLCLARFYLQFRLVK